MEYNYEERKNKEESGNFTWDDLSDYVQKRSSKSGGVVVLKENKWVLIGNVQVLLKETTFDMDTSYARIVTRPHLPWLDWLLLPIARLSDSGHWLMKEETCPNTNVIIDVWFVGDGTGGIYLAAQTK